MCKYTHTSFVCVRVCVCVCVCGVCVYVCVYVCMCVCVFIHTHTHTFNTLSLHTQECVQTTDKWCNNTCINSV